MHEVPYDPEGDPDEWWNSLGADRKHQIARWIASGRTTRVPDPGQRMLTDDALGLKH